MYRCIHRLFPFLTLTLLAGCPGTSELVICANDEPCGPGQECVAGKCVGTACKSGECPEGSACILGTCIPTCGAGAATSCTKGLTCCSKLCVDLEEGVNDCGSCGNSCRPYGDRCVRGACQCGTFSSCVLGKICCKGACTDADKNGRCPGAGPPDAGVDLPPKLDTKPWPPDVTPWPPDVKPWPDLPPKLDTKPWPPDMPVVQKDAPQPIKDSKPWPDYKKWPDYKVWPDVKPWPDTAPPKPTCGDGKCNGTETCLSCVFDCGTCPCTPGQKQSGKLGCGPCMMRQRTCSSAGQWNAYSGCTYQCSSVQFCVNDTCKPCWPGTAQSKACSCGTQTRTCKQSGDWGGWTSCVSTCQGGFSCISARCGRYYTAFSGAGGPECGSKVSGYSTIYYYCKPGDWCYSTYQKSCRVITACGAGSYYHAYSKAGGAMCGSKTSGYSTIYYYCKPMDTCVSSYQKKCRK